MSSPLLTMPGMVAVWENGAGLFQDAGATVPAGNDGDRIGCWQDQVGGNDLVQAISGQRATLTASTPYKAAPGVTFDHTLATALTSSTFGSTSGASGGCWFLAWYRPRMDRSQELLTPTGGAFGLQDSGGSLLVASSMNDYLFGLSRDGCYHGKAVVAIFDGSRSVAADRLRVRINRDERPPSFASSNGPPAALLPIVAAGLTMGSALTGTVLEAGYLARVPTEEEIAAWESYCGETFFAQGDKKVHVLGDSIPQGYPTGFDGFEWPAQLAGLLGAPWSVQNVSIVAYMIAQMELSGGAIDQDRDEWRVEDDVILECGTNDGLLGRTAAQALADMAVSVANRNAYGFDRVIVQTLPYAYAPAGGTPITQPEYEAFRADYNAGVRAGDTGASEVFDLEAEPGFEDPINTSYYSGDSVHLSHAGSAAVAAAASAMILAGPPPPPPPGAALVGAGIGLRRGGRP